MTKAAKVIIQSRKLLLLHFQTMKFPRHQACQISDKRVMYNRSLLTRRKKMLMIQILYLMLSSTLMES